MTYEKNGIKKEDENKDVENQHHGNGRRAKSKRHGKHTLVKLLTIT